MSPGASDTASHTSRSRGSRYVPLDPLAGVCWGWAGVGRYLGRSIRWAKRAHRFRQMPVSLINGRIAAPKLALDRWVAQAPKEPKRRR